jgi:hypothetical protein
MASATRPATTAEPSLEESGGQGGIDFAEQKLQTGNLTADAAVSAAARFWRNAHQRAKDTTDGLVDRDKTQAHNIVGAAVTLGLSVIMLILMAIVAGYFVAEAPSNGAFSEAINQVESIGGTAFILLAVALLAVPVVAVVGYFMRSGLGGFITGGGMRR